MLEVSNNKIYITRGDTATFELQIKQQDGEVYDYSEDTVIFSVKRSPYSQGGLIKKTVTDGKITLLPNDTANLRFGTYYYDVVLYKNNEVITVITPTVFTIEGEVHHV